MIAGAGARRAFGGGGHRRVRRRAALSPAPSPAPHRVRRMTNFVGLEEFSSISPDGRMVAFTAAQGGRRQVFIRYLNGGPPHPVTTDDADHQLAAMVA